MIRKCCAALALSLLSANLAAQDDDLIFRSGFEIATAFRIGDLDLRDPHVYVNVPIFGCRDVTDTPFAGFSVNDVLQTAIQTDEDGDGLLDLSQMQLFQPYATDGSGEIEITSGACLGPYQAPDCLRDPEAPSVIAAYQTQSVGQCLTFTPGTARPYAPAITSPSAICFASTPQDMTLTLPFGTIQLRDAQFGATFAVDPNSHENGLMRGFLSEADADAILLPADFPLVGGQPLSSLLPGGTNNCAVHSDKDTHKGVTGWWFYFNYVAYRSTWEEP